MGRTRLTRLHESLLKGNKEHLREINGSLVVYFGHDERSKLSGAAESALSRIHAVSKQTELQLLQKSCFPT